MYIPQCKVCNSQFKELIEQLGRQGLSAQKIEDYLRSLTKPEEIEIVSKEDIRSSNIRKHLKSHINSDKETQQISVAKTRTKIEKSRDYYNQGIGIKIDKIN